MSRTTVPIDSARLTIGTGQGGVTAPGFEGALAAMAPVRKPFALVVVAG